jgi:hypothetical protein
MPSVQSTRTEPGSASAGEQVHAPLEQHREVAVGGVVVGTWTAVGRVHRCLLSCVVP